MIDVETVLSYYGSVAVNVSFRNLTTFRVGGKARYVVSVNNRNDLIQLIDFLKQNEIDYKVFGNGSNILCSEEYYNGVIILLKNTFTKVRVNGNTIKADAGVSIINLSFTALNNSLSGLEFASGIPGTVGGCVYMNAGAYNCCMADIVKEVEVLDKNGNIITLSNEECNFSYRNSIFHNNEYIILSAVFEMKPGNKEEIARVMENRKAKRLASQPLEYPSAGSIFRNPENIPAWKCVDEIGYRGKRYGDITVSDKHSNFIVNVGQGSADDVNRLINEIKEKVKEKFDIELICEVEKFNWK